MRPRPSQAVSGGGTLTRRWSGAGRRCGSHAPGFRARVATPRRRGLRPTKPTKEPHDSIVPAFQWRRRRRPRRMRPASAPGPAPAPGTSAASRNRLRRPGSHGLPRPSPRRKPGARRMEKCLKWALLGRVSQQDPVGWRVSLCRPLHGPGGIGSRHFVQKTTGGGGLCRHRVDFVVARIVLVTLPTAREDTGQGETP